MLVVAIQKLQLLLLLLLLHKTGKKVETQYPRRTVASLLIGLINNLVKN